MRITASDYRQLGEKIFPAKPRREEHAATAKVTTTRFGFKLGKFGLNFTSRDVEIEPRESARPADAFRQSRYARLQSESLDVDSVRQSMDSDSKTRRGSGRVGMKDALKAYMRAAGDMDQPESMRFNLGVA